MGSWGARSRILPSGDLAGFPERKNTCFFKMGSRNRRISRGFLKWVCEKYRISRGVLWCPNAEVEKTLVFHVVS